MQLFDWNSQINSGSGEEGSFQVTFLLSVKDESQSRIRPLELLSISFFSPSFFLKQLPFIVHFSVCACGRSGAGQV